MVWTGLRYDTNERKFKWCSGSTTSYRNWCTGEPQVDEANNKLCVAMEVDRISSSIGRGCLKLIDCNKKLPYLCHRRCNNFVFMDNAVDAIDRLIQL